MLDSIYVGLTGLLGYSKSLKVISNNVANLNTPGFKSSQLQFADLFYSTQGSGGGGGSAQFGAGLTTLATVLDFKQGEIRQTGGELDAAIDGSGLFVLKDKQGQTLFSRAGQFGFDADGFLVSKADASRVQALTQDGQLVDISLAGLRVNAPKPTSSVKFTGNLSSTAAQDVVDSVKVIDVQGGEHLLKLTFKNNGSTTPGDWTVTVADDTGTVGTGDIRFQNGKPDPAASSFTVTYAPAGTTGTAITFDFSADTTSFASGTQSTLAVSSQDGFAVGVLTKVSFDEEGSLVMTYSNGQVVKNQRMALANFDRPDAMLEQQGGNEFTSQATILVQFGHASGGVFGKITAGAVEISNVDLSQQFSDLIVTQRGYQASSQVISTANELVQDLLDMRSKR